MNKFDRFCYKNEHWGVKNLMLLIVACTALVYVAGQLRPDILPYLYFMPDRIFAGEVWRIFTFIFVPPSYNLFYTAIGLYFYYFVGNMLEAEWGRLKFNIFYLTGMLATIAYCLLTGSAANAVYINLSMYFAYATLYPENRILLFFIIPVKIKYVAMATAVFFILLPLLSWPFTLANLLPFVALANYFLYFHKFFLNLFKRNRYQQKNVTQFRQEVRRTKQKAAHQGYTHKCAACDITNVDSPTTEFRYCSLCAHYECYCAQHIFTHEHTK